jgi:hypothetical protein
MTIKAATKFAIAGCILSAIMAITSPYLFDWAYNASGLDKKMVTLVTRVYWHIHTLFFDGGLLLFFITLSAKQKAKESQ